MTTNDSNTNPIKMKIAELEQMILTAHPSMPLLLKDIHGLLKSDPENVTLLTEEEVGILVSGLKRQTATEIATSALKKKPSLKTATIDML
jgi:hypothetical protein